ncbi:MAG: hypothetical protein BWY04_00701 [candidate division CPR1 bacterium ADurb.Bin160]|uniref:Uncharacterized protein n=1 Tax=candidate division CPR1 bacterium ADurb.Bin160 TaxID=1852826 RepID=A0A1V5ZNA1_9BACT|nr:MAG: hypothetical protein BWY04_00701 [candidate division CPR1 bacterium ADurb.Bin160]
MNIPKPILLNDLKEGELYIADHVLTTKARTIFVVKIKKIQLKHEDGPEKQIVFSRSSVRNYSIFSEIFGLDYNEEFFSTNCYFQKNYIQSKEFFNIYYFYNFDEEWFFKNKQKILLIVKNTNRKKSFPEIFREIQMEEL